MLKILVHIWNLFTEALFPHSPIERELFSLPYEDITAKFPPAPSYRGLGVALPESHSLFAYKNSYVEALIWNIKYKKSSQALSIGGRALSEYIQTHYLNENIILIPMPSSAQRRRERGYNQCELLVEAVTEQAKKSTQMITYRHDILTRSIHHGRHTLKGRKDRLDSAKGIFEASTEDISSLDNTHIIIIDDVITTGSTMREAVDTLKKAGFSHVSGLSLAH